jgi:deoxyribonuclease V
VALQNLLRSQVLDRDGFTTVSTVAGVDVGFEQKGTITRAAIAILSWPDLELLDQAIARLPTCFPYIPGLLSFREIPAILLAFQQLTVTPDLLLCDGQGLAHPRRLGIACHLGLLTNLPSIGVGKSRLIGTHPAVGNQRGDWQPLCDRQQVIGAVLRTRSHTHPLYISIGHRICLETAIAYVIGCTRRYRLPETTRWAHRLASG